MEKANVIQKAFYRSAAYLKRHSPTILTFVGATGVVATTPSRQRSSKRQLLTKKQEKKKL